MRLTGTAYREGLDTTVSHPNDDTKILSWSVHNNDGMMIQFYVYPDGVIAFSHTADLGSSLTPTQVSIIGKIEDNGNVELHEPRSFEQQAVAGWSAVLQLLEYARDV